MFANANSVALTPHSTACASGMRRASTLMRNDAPSSAHRVCETPYSNVHAASIVSADSAESVWKQHEPPRQRRLLAVHGVAPRSRDAAKTDARKCAQQRRTACEIKQRPRVSESTHLVGTLRA